jgi:hypothetical protein
MPAVKRLNRNDFICDPKLPSEGKEFGDETPLGKILGMRIERSKRENAQGRSGGRHGRG